MKAELTFAPELINEIAEKVIERLLPLLSNNGDKHDDALMTIDETADFLRTSKGQVYQWVNNTQHGLGNFPYHKAGRLLRFSKAEILAWMKTNPKRLEGR